MPSFAGAYYDSDGNFVVLATDTAAAEAGRGVFEREHRNHTKSDRGSVVVRPAKYRFLELAAWRDATVGAFAEEPWIVSVDLDEVENRITIGVDKADAPSIRATVMQRLTSLGVPPEALRIFGTDRPRPDVAFAALTEGGTINETVRPLVGGTVIWGYWPGPNGGDPVYNHCVLGFLTRFNGLAGLYMVTNSHCSTGFWSRDLGPYYQQSDLLGEGARHIGAEFWDPIPGRCWYWYHYVDCRESESTLVRLDDTVSVGVGMIARTLYAGTGNSPGSLDIDPTNPVFYVTATEHGVYAGDPIQKVGSMTGWTAGTVYRTCQTKWPYSGRMLKCQHQATYWSVGGDSGSPVFRLTGGSNVTLYGINWGRDSDPDVAVYSGYRSIETDFGHLDDGTIRPIF